MQRTQRVVEANAKAIEADTEDTKGFRYSTGKILWGRLRADQSREGDVVPEE